MDTNKITIYYDFFKSCIGNILAASNNDSIIRIVLPRNRDSMTFAVLKNEFPKAAFLRKSSPFGSLFSQLEQYFSGNRKSFNVKLLLNGSNFQKNVWTAIATIPFGKTASYKSIAIKTGNIKAARAVGNACNANPIPIVIPCHRIISSSGSIGGFGGGVPMKKKLLQMEGLNTDNL